MSTDQVIYEHGDPRDYCMGCDHYHDPAEGCAVVDSLGRGFVIDKGRYWPACAARGVR